MAGSDRDLARRRRGRWIRLARERRELTTDGLAAALGYKGAKPGSVVSRWESGERAVPSDLFPAIAAVLQLPAEWLTNPPMTDLERLEERLDELMNAAARLERDDWAAGEDRAPEDGDGPAGEPHTRIA